MALKPMISRRTARPECVRELEGVTTLVTNAINCRRAGDDELAASGFLRAARRARAIADDDIRFDPKTRVEAFSASVRLELIAGRIKGFGLRTVEKLEDALKELLPEHAYLDYQSRIRPLTLDKGPGGGEEIRAPVERFTYPILTGRRLSGAESAAFKAAVENSEDFAVYVVRDRELGMYMFGGKEMIPIAAFAVDKPSAARQILTDRRLYGLRGYQPGYRYEGGLERAAANTMRDLIIRFGSGYGFSTDFLKAPELVKLDEFTRPHPEYDDF
ncbi:MAG: hypothetical protein KGH72_03735 [Candidatus Micrarchaeota archaeon]|nr:hypothetical protein [Candidatus Micrarchaeota archaeon]